MDPDAWVPLAEVARPHGIRGELRLRLFNKDSDALLGQEEVLVRLPDGEEHEVSVERARRADDAILMKLHSVDDRDRADELRGAMICLRRRDFDEPDEGEFYAVDIIGAEVRVKGERIGTVAEIVTYPSIEAMWINADDGKGDWEVPLTEGFIGKVDVAAKLVELVTLDEIERQTRRKEKPKKDDDDKDGGFGVVRVDVVTLFPELFGTFSQTSFVGRAMTGGQLELRLRSPRDFGLGKHKSVDDTPYGGGSGMVMRVDVMIACMESLDADAAAEGKPRAHRVLLTPQGKPFAQPIAARYATTPALMLVCGRYEGFDERIRGFVDEEISLGDFVMTGGEIAAMAVIEAAVRLIPGVLGNEDSTREESHGEEGLLEYPQYTRPAEFRGVTVPEVLASGNHAHIAEWRKKQSLERTIARRPNLVKRGK